MADLESRTAVLALIDRLADDQVELILDLIRNLLDPDGLDPQEERDAREALERMKAGEFVSQDDLLAELVRG